MSSLNWFSVLLVVVSVSQNTHSAEDSSQLSRAYLENIINHVNSVGALWEAGHNFEEIDHTMVQHMVGTEHKNDGLDDITHIEHIYDHHPNMAPEEVKHLNEFDAIKKWSRCSSIKQVKNQGKCASDWVLAPVSALSDRLCIASNGTKSVELSPHEPLSCCKTCGWGCRKGYPQMVYKQFVTKGLVTGGSYKSNKGCQPYEIKPCNGNLKKCFMAENYQTPKCKPHCYNRKYKTKYAKDRKKGSMAFKNGCPYCMAGELSRHGPVTATMKVYEDFLTYKTGVYHHVSGKALGFLTVKLVGFNDGIGNDTTKPAYWVAVNSWGKKWGDRGMFKIKRAVDECMIEGSMRAAMISDEYKRSSEEDESKEDFDKNVQVNFEEDFEDNE